MARHAASTAAMQRKRDGRQRRGQGCRRWVLVTSSVSLDGSVVLHPFADAPSVLEGSYDEIKRIADAHNVGRTRGNRLQVRKAFCGAAARLGRGGSEMVLGHMTEPPQATVAATAATAAAAESSLSGHDRQPWCQWCQWGDQSALECIGMLGLAASIVGAALVGWQRWRLRERPSMAAVH
eukprot:COSAG01_NODE_4114_length_5336_cov_23.503055_5_plen_180_part_00